MKTTNKIITFDNGKSFNVYTKETKAGLRYFYYSSSNMRYIPVSKARINGILEDFANQDLKTEKTPKSC